VGRLIRRGTVEVKDEITTLTNPHGESEFIRITQTGSAEGNDWSFHELAVLKAGGKF
jgi:hypothetical protein